MMGGEKQYKIVWFNNIIIILSFSPVWWRGLSYRDGWSARKSPGMQVGGYTMDRSVGALCVGSENNNCNQRYPTNLRPELLTAQIETNHPLSSDFTRHCTHHYRLSVEIDSVCRVLVVRLSCFLDISPQSSLYSKLADINIFPIQNRQSVRPDMKYIQ